MTLINILLQPKDKLMPARLKGHEDLNMMFAEAIYLVEGLFKSALYLKFKWVHQYTQGMCSAVCIRTLTSNLN